MEYWMNGTTHKRNIFRLLYPSFISHHTIFPSLISSLVSIRKWLYLLVMTQTCFIPSFLSQLVIVFYLSSTDITVIFFLMRAVWRQFNRAHFPITSVQGKPTSSFKINSSIYTFKPFKVKTWLDKYTSFIAVTLAACNRRQFCPMITTKSIICMGNRGALISGVSHQVAK